MLEEITLNAEVELLVLDNLPAVKEIKFTKLLYLLKLKHMANLEFDGSFSNFDHVRIHVTRKTARDIYMLS